MVKIQFLRLASSAAVTATADASRCFSSAPLHDPSRSDVRFFQVLVVPFGMCWGLDLAASLVVVMGTESYDGREHKYVDYPVTDLLHMTGLASRCAIVSDMRDIVANILYYFLMMSFFFSKCTLNIVYTMSGLASRLRVLFCTRLCATV